MTSRPQSPTTGSVAMGVSVAPAALDLLEPEGNGREDDVVLPDGPPRRSFPFGSELRFLVNGELLCRSVQAGRGAMLAELADTKRAEFEAQGRRAPEWRF